MHADQLAEWANEHADGSPPRDAGVVAILTPTGRDAALAAEVLAGAGIPTTICADVAALCRALGSGIGAALVAEEALGLDGTEVLLATLAAQPSWSDLPVIVLTGEHELSRAIPRALQTLTTRANVTLLERPVRIATLVTVLRTALRARSRQLDVGRHLEERRRLLANERTARAGAEKEARRAAEANRAKSDFLAMMSHELRTPLNAIAGYTQLLEMEVRGPVTAEQRADLDRIERSQRHLLSLINDVLNYAKLEAGRVHFAIAPVPMREILVGVEALIAPQLRAKKLRYIDGSDCGDIAILADEEKVRQILLNLLSNAVKFTPPEGEISVSCVAVADTVHTTVRDSGAGIPPDKLEAIFEPFVQVDRGLSSRQEGTGLGLAISRDLAQRMGGNLTAHSELGQGSAFTLTLPRAPRVPPAPDAAE